jgi:hypothetical protein
MRGIPSVVSPPIHVDLLRLHNVNPLRCFGASTYSIRLSAYYVTQIAFSYLGTSKLFNYRESMPSQSRSPA